MPEPHREYHEALQRLDARLPGFAAKSLNYLVESSPWVRVPPALAFIVGGTFGFLPILGFWMIPLGLILLAQDVPPLRRPLCRALNWLDRKLPEQKKSEAKTGSN
jgi:hypothetical protein